MFRDFDVRFFKGILVSRAVQVDWSDKMTNCAGLCRWKPNSLECEIKLSKPLLILRSRKDLVETLIHEMIHALLFVTRNSDNHESHGPEFHKHMYRINSEASLNISVYHTFHDEVRHYQTHVWRCNGICKQRHPFYGWVRRAMNRKPGPNDRWWSEHQRTCGGQFEKVSEPEGFGQKKTAKSAKENQPLASNQMKDIRTFFTPVKADQPSISSQSNSSSSADKASRSLVDFDLSSPNKIDLNPPIVPFSGKGQVLGGGSTNGPHSGKSNLLLKFGNSQKSAACSTATSRVQSANATNSNPIRNKQSIVLEDSIRTRPLDEPVDLVSPPNKRKCLNETLTLSDDDEDFSWLDNLNDNEILGISSNIDCIVID